MKKKIKPREGFIVRDPLTREVLPAKGAEVEISVYWLRRLKGGDVVAVEPRRKEKADD